MRFYCLINDFFIHFFDLVDLDSPTIRFLFRIGENMFILRNENVMKFINHQGSRWLWRPLLLRPSPTTSGGTRGDFMAPVDGCHCTTLYPLVV
jgi:hypothetical protein